MKRFPTIALGVMLALCACNANQTQAPSRLRGPTDLRVAGPLTSNGYPHYMFTAGVEKNLVYVLDLSSLQPVRAPNLFFPLEIVVGAGPTALASTVDGKYLLVLCSLERRVWVVDTNTLKVVRGADQKPLTLDVGGRGGEQLLRVASADRFYVPNTLDGSLTTFELSLTSDGSLAFGAQAILSNVGAISRAVLSEDGTALYGADISSRFVHRVSLPDGAKIDFDVGGPSTDVALIGNGGALLVALPDSYSVGAFNPSNGARLNTDPVLAPRLSDDQDFYDIFLGKPPLRIFAFEATQSDMTFEKSCASSIQTQMSQVLNSYAIAATDSGELYYIQNESTAGEAHVELMNTYYCDEDDSFVEPAPINTVAPLFSTDGSELARNPFESCANTEGRRRARCAQAKYRSGTSSGVRVFPGYTANGEVWALQFEAVVPGALRNEGGGTLVDERTVGDVGVNLASLDTRPGDKLIVTALPAALGDCRTTYGNSADASLREFEIEGVVKQNGVDVFKLAQPIDTTCFTTEAGKLEYMVRAGGSFLISRTDPTTGLASYMGRIKPGETFGGNFDQSVLFKLRSDLLSPRPAEIVRDSFIAFQVYAPFNAIIGGRSLLQDGSLVPVGSIPTALVYSDSGPNSQLNYGRMVRAFVTYSGSDLLFSYDYKAPGATSYFSYFR